MSSQTGFTLARYAPYRPWVEIGGWVTFFLLNALANTVVVLMDFGRVDLPVVSWHPAVWEFSSAITQLVLIPLLLAFDQRFPLRRDTWRRNWPWHVLGSVVYSALHVGGMVALRKLVYLLAGETYDFGPWLREFGYEYLKDVRGYASLLAVVYLYRLLILRLQGEVRLLDAPDDDAPPGESLERPERFLVRKLGREFLIAAKDIEYLQASGNYVNLHLRGRDYPLRSTIAGVEERLDPARFQRVHRSYILNLDHLVSIEPLETGDARLHLADGSTLPCSRRYRAQLRGRVGADVAGAEAAA